ncbi:MAG: transcription termination factor Rho [Terrimicrobiaceae bacterium]|nr:transcription termination factor Rho [Terrimicrobiaceae bacterium]
MTDVVTPEAPPSGTSTPGEPQPLVISLNALQALDRAALAARAREFSIRLRPEGGIHHLILDQARFHLQRGDAVTADAIFDLESNRGILRWEKFSFRACPEDVSVPQPLIRAHNLRAGLKIHGRLRLPEQREHGLVLDSVLTVEGRPAAEWTTPADFEKLTPLFPNRRIFLETPGHADLGPRAIDLIAPLGMGQRGLIVAPPRAGKTVLLSQIAQAIRRNHPAIHLILLLVDERPEEVTDFERSLDCDIFSSTFDESPARHVALAELVSERAKRLVETGRDVVILLDSITRLSRGYNNLQPNKGSRTMSGGVDSKALVKPKKFFGAARNVEEGGSLTILATALVETQSRMDDLIFEEYKGTGNMEIHLDRTIAELRIFPAIHITKSGTRREDLLLHPDEFDRTVALRKQLAELPAVEAMEVLQTNLQHTSLNAELLLGSLRGC